MGGARAAADAANHTGLSAIEFAKRGNRGPVAMPVAPTSDFLLILQLKARQKSGGGGGYL